MFHVYSISEAYESIGLGDCFSAYSHSRTIFRNFFLIYLHFKEKCKVTGDSLIVLSSEMNPKVSVNLIVPVPSIVVILPALRMVSVLSPLYTIHSNLITLQARSIDF